MKIYFIINPTSGRGKAVEFIPKIEEIKQSNVYITTKKGEAEIFVHEICKKGEKCRFYAVGGDGTFNEVINGAYGYDNAQVGLIPAGTGNDFIRCFDNREDFVDIISQLNGIEKPIDTIKVTFDNNITTRFVNMGNIGFDCDVVIRADEVKSKFNFGPINYLIGVIFELIKNWGQKIKVTFDNGEICEINHLLSTIANGKYCGGGFCSSPYADMSDGLIDIAIIEKIGKFKFITMLNKYRKGTYLKDESVKNLLTYRQTKKVKVEMDKKQGICIDGEIYRFKTAIFENENKSIRFIIPKSTKY